jgi:hypothetical protein
VVSGGSQSYILRRIYTKLCLKVKQQKRLRTAQIRRFLPPARSGVFCWQYWPILPVPPERDVFRLGAVYQYLCVYFELHESLPFFFKRDVRTPQLYDTVRLFMPLYRLGLACYSSGMSKAPARPYGIPPSFVVTASHDAVLQAVHKYHLLTSAQLVRALRYSVS